MANKPIRILGIAGSLRRESYNRAALRAATKLAPEGAVLETFDLDGIPGFNQDDEQNPSQKIVDLKALGHERLFWVGGPEAMTVVKRPIPPTPTQASAPVLDAWCPPCEIMQSGKDMYGPHRGEYNSTNSEICSKLPSLEGITLSVATSLFPQPAIYGCVFLLDGHGCDLVHVRVSSGGVRF